MVATVTVLDSAGSTQTVNTLPALGQALKAASLPVALASDTGTLAVSLATAPTTPVTGTFWQATQPVSGTVTSAGSAGSALVQDAGGRQIMSGGISTGRLLSAAASTNATSVKASAGYVKQLSGFNASSAAKYLKLYDKASAPTVGSDTPRKTVYIPALAPFVIDCNDYFATGIAYAITGAAADADTTALAAGDILCLNVDYN